MYKEVHFHKQIDSCTYRFKVVELTKFIVIAIYLLRCNIAAHMID